MRKIMLILVVGLLAHTALAGNGHYTEIVLAGLTGGTSTVANVRGFVEEIYCDSPSAVTGNVVVSYQPVISTMAAVTMATNMVSSDTIWRPAYDRTDVKATALTSDQPGRYCLAGETVKFVVTESPTNLTWKLYLKTSEY